MLSIEGRIRDLGLAEVFQLLARSRKTGALDCEAPLLSRVGRVVFLQGHLVDAAVAPLGTRLDATPVIDAPASGPRSIEEAALDLLCWRDGTFRFVPVDATVLTPRVRLAVEPLLIEAAQRAIVWDRIEARVPHARVVPAFSELEPGQLPALRLSPAQWEILTHVDGERDLVSLATVMQREFTDVAELVHDLIAIGLLVVREAPVAPRRNPTPPTNVVFTPDPVEPPTPSDLWIPDHHSAGAIRMPGDLHLDPLVDAIFDPVEVGVLTPEGLPAVPPGAAAATAQDGALLASPGDAGGESPEAVAASPAEPSLGREQAAASAPESAHSEGSALCRRGDERLRRGDLMGAVRYWEAALRAAVPVDDAERLREVIALATRLHALVPR